jgi:hypothetical protein
MQWTLRTFGHQFSWVLQDMREGGCFFEGYIPTIGVEDLWSALSNVLSNADHYTFQGSVWAEDTTKADWEKSWSPHQYVEFFHSGRIIVLCLSYGPVADNIALEQMLMFDKDERSTTLEIICYREPILEYPNPKEAVRTAIHGFRRLKSLFEGDALFIGPDNLDYPKSSAEYPSHWLRIE